MPFQIEFPWSSSLLLLDAESIPSAVLDNASSRAQRGRHHVAEATEGKAEGLSVPFALEPYYRGRLSPLRTPARRGSQGTARPHSGVPCGKQV
jgi:hypothetical protein